MGSIGLMVEICFKSLVRAMGKVLLIEINQLKRIKVLKNGPCL